MIRRVLDRLRAVPHEVAQTRERLDAQESAAQQLREMNMDQKSDLARRAPDEYIRLIRTAYPRRTA